MIRSLERCDTSQGGEISIAGVVGVIVLFRVLHEGDEYLMKMVGRSLTVWVARVADKKQVK